MYTSFPNEFTTPKILWVRSFSKIYNPLMAVKVFIKIKANFPEAKICMVGPKKDDSYTKTLQFAKKNNVEVWGVLMMFHLIMNNKEYIKKINNKKWIKGNYYISKDDWVVYCKTFSIIYKNNISRT